MTTAIQIFEVLPEDGSSITGKQLKEALPDVGAEAIRQAKRELKDAGRVVLGRGRGGKIARAEGAEAPEAPKKLTKDEALVRARQEKEYLSREQKARNARTKRADAIKALIAKERDISVDDIDVTFTGQEESPLVHIWKDGAAPGFRIKDEVLMQEGLV